MSQYENDLCSSKFNSGQGFTHVSVCASYCMHCCNCTVQQRNYAQLYKCLRWPQNAGKLASEHPFCKKISGGACPQTPLAWATYVVAAYSSHVGFAHKLGNPLPQILDPPLYSHSYCYLCSVPEAIAGNSGCLKKGFNTTRENFARVQEIQERLLRVCMAICKS